MEDDDPGFTALIRDVAERDKEIAKLQNANQRLRLAILEALGTLEQYADEDMPPNVTGLFIGRFRAELAK